MEKNNRQTKGVSLQTLARIFAILGLLLLIILSFSLRTAVSDYKLLAKDFDLHMNSHDSIDALQTGSDDMTKLSGLFAVTQNPDCMQKYFDIVNNHIREDAHDTLVSCFSGKGFDESIEKLNIALDESDALMDVEIHSMKLITEAADIAADQIPEAVAAYTLPAEEENWSSEQKMEYAVELVFGADYRRDKDQIDADITAAIASMSDDMKNDLSVGMTNLGHLITYMTGLCMILAILLIVVFIINQALVIYPIRQCILCIQEKRKFSIIGPRELRYLAATYNDMFERNEAAKQHTDYLLEHDTLTDASSKLAFEEHKKVLSASQVPIGLLVFDVDHFKEVNDTYGHKAGDQALVRIVHVIHSFLRSNDIIARIGGDEFAAVLMNMDAKNADVMGEKLDQINQILQNPEDGSPKLSLSIGAAFSTNGYSEELFQQADQALYEAKENGRCCYRIYKQKA